MDALCREVRIATILDTTLDTIQGALMRFPSPSMFRTRGLKHSEEYLLSYVAAALTVYSRLAS